MTINIAEILVANSCGVYGFTAFDFQNTKQRNKPP